MNYTQYLLTATTVEEYRFKFGQLVRNTRGRLTLGLTESKMLDEYLLDNNLDAAMHIGLAMLRELFTPAYTVPKRRRMRDARQCFLEDVAEYGQYDFDSEELVPVIHGGALGRIHAIIHHKRGYAAYVHAPNMEKLKMDDKGFMVHNVYAGRARYYAQASAAQHMGIPAILMARVPKKYLYENQGDEYTLHTWHYAHMTDIQVLTHEDEAYYEIESYYKENYLVQQ